MDTWAAVIIGVVAGWVYLAGSKALIRLRIDDAVDAIPVHMVGGAWGVLATGLFTKPDLLQQAFGQDEHVGWFYEWGRGSGNFTLMGAQLVGILFTFGWVFTVMGVYFYFLNYMGWLRIDPLEEEVGMDISRHKGAAWVIEGAKGEAVSKLSQNRASILEDTSSRRGSKRNVNKSSSTKNENEHSETKPNNETSEVPSDDIIDGDHSAHC